MALSWGGGSGSGNAHYVGIDVEVGATSATVRLYAKAQYSVSDNQTMSWSGAASGSKVFNHAQSGGSAVLVASFTVAGSASQTKTIVASLSGVYNGGSPSHSATWTFPAPGIVAPNPPTEVGMSTDGYTKSTVWFTASAPAPTRPVGHYRIERYDWTVPSAGYVFQGTTTSTSAAFTNLWTNHQYSYRVCAVNGAGSSGWAYSVQRQTIPWAPDPITLARTSGGGLLASWGDESPWNSFWDVIFEAGGVPSAAVEVPKASRTLAKSSPDPMVSHRVGVRSRTANGLTSAYTWSASLALLSKPNPPSAVSGGVADPAFPVEQSWVHGSVDGSPQTMYQAQWRPSGSSGAWTVGSQVASAAQRSTWPAGTFTAGTNVEVQVRTKGAHASWSDWSATSVWLWDTTPVAALVKPGTTYASTTMKAEWTSSVAQSQWRTVLMDAAGFALETLTGSGATLRASFKYRLASGTSYRVSVETRSPGGLWSAPVERLTAVTFPAPALVSVSVTWDAVRGWAQCEFVAAPARTYELAADGSSVEKDSAGMVLRRNYATNPYPTMNAAGGWGANNGYWSMTNDTSLVRRPGTVSRKSTANTVPAAQETVLSLYSVGAVDFIPCTPGQVLTYSAYTMMPGRGFQSVLRATFHDAAGTALGPIISSAFTAGIPGIWARPVFTFTVPADPAITKARLFIDVISPPAPVNGLTAYAQDVQVEEGTVATPYFDGKMANTVIPQEVDLYRSDNGATGPWELVAEGVPLDGTTITDTEPAVDGRAVWVARARNTELGTESDGPMATTEITGFGSFISCGPGYESVVPLLYNKKTRLLTGRPDRSVIVLDGGDKPRRVIVDTPVVERVLDFDGRLYSEEQPVASRDDFEEMSVQDGPHLYRDRSGRKTYGSLSMTPVDSGHDSRWWDVSFTLVESDRAMITAEVKPA